MISSIDLGSFGKVTVPSTEDVQPKRRKAPDVEAFSDTRNLDIRYTGDMDISAPLLTFFIVLTVVVVFLIFIRRIKERFFSISSIAKTENIKKAVEFMSEHSSSNSSAKIAALERRVSELERRVNGSN